jgi:hypothetical protein
MEECRFLSFCSILAPASAVVPVPRGPLRRFAGLVSDSLVRRRVCLLTCSRRGDGDGDGICTFELFCWSFNLGGGKERLKQRSNQDAFFFFLVFRHGPVPREIFGCQLFYFELHFLSSGTLLFLHRYPFVSVESFGLDVQTLPHIHQNTSTS